jgi:hypothetical protein
VSEPQHVEAASGGRFVVPSATSACRASEVHQSRLLRVQRQTVPTKALGQHRHHSPCVLLMLKPQRDIISVANDKRSPLQSRLDLVFEPPVQDFVQVDVAQQGTYYSLDTKANFQFDRRITRWRGKWVVDLRRKEYYSYVTWRDPRKRRRRKD